MFLREGAPDVLTIVPWCGSLRNMFVSQTLGGLPCGVGTLHSGPACANIFLMRLY